MNSIIKEVLLEFSDVFNDPKGLPPEHGHKHTIVLKDGITPINVRSYRYPHIQENEIEKLVSEMLEARVIRTSESPLFSSVLLVRKKDAS